MKMSSIEDKIIEATVSCIEKYGIKKTTIRQIGKEAGVNSASINYYFRSKDILMQHVMKVVLNNAFDLGNFESTRDLHVKERLIAIFVGMIVGALQYPNITRSVFSELFHSNNYNSPVIQSCNTFIGELECELKEAYPDISQYDIRMILMQAASSTFLFLGLFPGFYSGFPEINLSDANIRRDYVEKLINKLL
jgi:TetR/AcrR family transcriptional regulator, regulator of cefoperazone and chloramphenicol sensitivity